MDTVLPALSRVAEGPRRDDPAWIVAQKLETVFLSEMLKAAEPTTSFSGSDSDQSTSQFSSILRSAQADAISDSGGIGLARQIFDSMHRQT